MSIVAKFLRLFRRRPTCGHPQGNHAPGDDGLPLYQSLASGHYHCFRGPWPWSSNVCYWHEHSGGGGGGGW